MSGILIIDDDVDVLETIGALLEHAGLKVHTTDNLESGLNMIETLSPELVLLDLLLPDNWHQGSAVPAATIKAKHPRLPLFILTSINREYALDITRNEIPAEEFLTKPVRIDRLLALIDHHLGRQRGTAPQSG